MDGETGKTGSLDWRSDGIKGGFCVGCGAANMVAERRCTR